MAPRWRGFGVVQERAVGFAKENAERSFALASDLSRAKDMQEVLTLQSRYVQTQMQTFGIQAQQTLLADGRRAAQHAIQGLRRSRFR